MTSALDTTTIDIFQEDTTLSVSSELYATSPIGTTYKETTVYEIYVENICCVEVETECVLADDSNIDCRYIPPSKEPEDCEVVVEYLYLVTNTDPQKTQTIDKVV